MCEGVAMLVELMVKETVCEHKPEAQKWVCKLDGESTRLAGNITDHKDIPKPSVPARLSGVTSDSWPSQAHHLIPWQQLLKHPVTQWLAKKKQKLRGDNDYSVDHGNNGKFMPYASDLREWSGANTDRKRAIVEAVMTAAGIQLHQGPHSYKPYGVGEDGYKTRVGEYLDAIKANSHDHFSAKPPCEDCKNKADGKKLPPRRNVVRYMDGASKFIEGDIDTGKIFVSRRAAEFVAAGGVL